MDPSDGTGPLNKLSSFVSQTFYRLDFVPRPKSCKFYSFFAVFSCFFFVLRGFYNTTLFSFHSIENVFWSHGAESKRPSSDLHPWNPNIVLDWEIIPDNTEYGFLPVKYITDLASMYSQYTVVDPIANLVWVPVPDFVSPDPNFLSDYANERAWRSASGDEEICFELGSFWGKCREWTGVIAWRITVVVFTYASSASLRFIRPRRARFRA